MGTLLKIAFRNIFRSGRRTVITFSTIALGLTLLMVSVSLLDGIDLQSKNSIVFSRTSHLNILARDYFESRETLPLNKTIKNPTVIINKLLNEDYVVSAVPRTVFRGGLIVGMDELPCMGISTDTKLSPAVFNIKENLKEGQWLKDGDYKCVIGVDLASDTGLKTGDSVTFRMVSSDDENNFSWNAVDFEVGGIFDSGNPEVDSSMVYIPSDIGNESLSLDNEVTEICVRLKPGTDPEEAAEKLKNSIKELPVEIYTWKDLAGAFLAINKSKKRNSSVIIFILLFISSMGIVNTMLMAVLERTSEIGTLMAMGMKKRELLILFMTEGGIIGLAGSILGATIGGALSIYIEKYGINLGIAGESIKKLSAATYPVKDAFYGIFSFEHVIIAIVLGTLFAVLATIYPALKATSLNPVDAIRKL